ncbi:glucosaminidase domain-containing protein [Photobacterium aquae]|uniref:glucosaminidase domain-containing protein n=1 Tax=Photobacterium aquae TaxID=1195763 RepID=UPI00069E6C36|nr:glucosaminidase domain-containing protein [Photobacterium aquae]
MIKNNKTKSIALIAFLTSLTACEDTPNKSQPSEELPLAAEAASSKPDFSAYKDVKQKKAAFFDFLRPAVIHENQRIEKERQFLLGLVTALEAGKPVDGEDLAYAIKLAAVYKLPVQGDSVTPEWLSEVLIRVDTLPQELVLSQAANESGWGTSRFAVQGNNYFGQWCYRKGCGLVPSARNDGADHEVAVFATPYLSVQAYFSNVNTNRAYKELREIRASQRQMGETVTGIKLAEGLIRYSERGSAYVEEIQAMIRHNNEYWRQG